MARVAVLVAEGFEDSELRVPLERLRAADHEAVLIGAEAGGPVEGKRGEEKVTLDAAAGEVGVDDFDALLIPGGHSPDHLRLDREVVALTRRFVDSGKTVAVVCHGPQLLIEADAVRGRTLTSWPSVRKDLENAGATWIDRPLVEDGNLISSRNPDDLEVFSQALLERL